MSGFEQLNAWGKRVALVLSLAVISSCSVTGPPPPAPEPQVTPSPIMTRATTWTFYRDPYNRFWYWKEVASNGRVIGLSDQGYQRIYFAKKNAAKHGWVQGQSNTKIE